jgi:hypothetical protein
VRRALILGLVCAAALGAVGVSYAAFSSTTDSPPSSFESMAVFPRDRSVSAWDVRDSSSGTESNQSSPFGFTDDNRTDVSDNWTNGNSYNTNNFVEFDFNNPLPGGRAVSSVELRFRYATTGSNTACFYYDVRKASDNSVLATYGGTGNDQGCVTGTTLTTHIKSIPILTTTDEANDLRIRIYVRRPGSSTITIDRAVVSVPFTYATVLLYPTKHIDRADGSNSTTWWGPALLDDNSYQSTNTFSSSFASDRYVTFKFPSTVPSTATITSASVDLAYRRQTNGNACIYFEVLNGSAVAETHGSTGSPFCNSTGNFTPILTEALTSVTTPGKANNLSLKIYGRTSNGRRIQWDLVRLNTNWSVDAGAAGGGGCTDPGSQTVLTTRDGWTDQASPSSTSGGGDSKLYVNNKSPNSAQRSFVYFALPSIPAGCAITEATLRVYQISSPATRTIEAYQAAATPTWTEANLSWNNSPAPTGTPTTTTSASNQWRSWDVTAAVEAMIAGTNNGFVLKDSAEGSGSEAKQEYASREDTSYFDAELYVAWG